jgi:hypothetical protein
MYITTRIITSAFDLVLLWLWTIITGLLHLKFSSTKYTTICRFWVITWPFFCFISLTIVRYKTLCPTCPITKASIYDWNKWNNFRLIKWKQYWLIREYYKCCWLILSVYILMSFWLSLCKIVRSSVILLLPLLECILLLNTFSSIKVFLFFIFTSI